MVPYPSWLNAGDTSWQLTAATLVGLLAGFDLLTLSQQLQERRHAGSPSSLVPR